MSKIVRIEREYSWGEFDAPSDAVIHFRESLDDVMYRAAKDDIDLDWGTLNIGVESYLEDISTIADKDFLNRTALRITIAGVETNG